MQEWIVLAAGLGIGVASLAGFVKQNLEGRQRERRLQKENDELKDQLAKGQLIGQERVIAEDRKLIASAQGEVWILGIVGLMVLSQSRDELVRLLGKGGKVRVLLLHPESKAFGRRERDEEEVGGHVSGRLRAEYAASLANCRDIARLSGRGNGLELKARDVYPEYAAVIRDPGTQACRAHKNSYPPGKLTRGCSGEHRAIIEAWPDALAPLIEEYEKLWKAARPVDFLGVYRSITPNNYEY